jgi:2-dehydropantoate 2-reductase
VSRGACPRAGVGPVGDLDATRALLTQALTEIHTVALARGIALPADGTMSMQRDVIEGRPSELEAQIGAVVRLGEASGVPVPLHRTTYAALLPLERRARGELGFA